MSEELAGLDPMNLRLDRAAGDIGRQDYWRIRSLEGVALSDLATLFLPLRYPTIINAAAMMNQPASSAPTFPLSRALRGS